MSALSENDESFTYLEQLLAARRLREPRPTTLTRRASATIAEETLDMHTQEDATAPLRNLAELAIMSKLFAAIDSAKAWYGAAPDRRFVDPELLKKVMRVHEAERQEGDVLVAVLQVSLALRPDEHGELQPIISHGVTGSVPVNAALGLVIAHEMEKKCEERTKRQDEEFAAYPVCPDCGKRHPTETN